MSTPDLTSANENQSAWTFRVKNFRALDSLDWSPSGVCLLAGPNGSGKTTVLNTLLFPRYLYSHDLTTALRIVGGASALRHLSAPGDAPVTFEFASGDVAWRIEIPIEGVGVHPFYGEQLMRGDVVEYEARPYESTARIGGAMQGRHERKTGLHMLWTSKKPPWLRAMVTRLTQVRIHYSYDLDAVCRPDAGEAVASDYLHPRGRNLWAVLKRWEKSENLTDRARLEWVLEQALQAFPDIIADLRFDGPNDEPRLYIPRHEEQGIPVHLAADGLLVGLLHLTAVAGATPGMLLAFDEMENQLHPHAIRSILAAMRERADEYNLTMVLTTHSPVLMNEFKGHEDSFFILDRSIAGAPFPTPLSRVKDPKWLRHFSLGDLYEREEFGAPVVPASAPSHTNA
jgi:predicted ATPase